MTHLTHEELIDALEGIGSFPDRQAHLAGCEHCQGEIANLSNVLAEAKQAAVPEPSPFFWQHFSERVRTAIDDDAARSSNWPAWLRWQVLAPIGAMAVIVLALAMSIPTSDVPDTIVVDDLGAGIELVDDSWSTVAALVGDIDVETASAAGVIEPGVAERAVLELSAEEQRELTRLLRAELTRAKL